MRLFKLLSTTYDKFDDTIQSFLANAFKSSGLPYSPSSLYGVLLQGIKGVMQNIMFYIEDAITEQNIFTAIRKKSIYGLAKLSGYDVWYGSSAVGTVYIKNKVGNGLESGSVKLIVPNKTVITNQSTGYDYLVWLPVDCIVIDMNRPLVAYDIKIVQGKMESARYVAKGEKLESFTVSPSGLFDMSYVEVYVDNVKYNIVHNVYDMGENSKEVVVTTGYDGGMSVIFGDGNHGTQLSEGSSITVSYVVHDGSYGNVSYNDSPDLEFKTNLIDGLGNEVNGNDYLTLTLTNYISGGSDSDSISTVRNLVGCNSRSLVLASEDNFKLFLSRYSFISTANILMHSNSLTATICPLLNVSVDDYISTSTSSLFLSDFQKSMLLTAIEESKKTFAGLTINIIDPIVRKYAIVCYVKCESVYGQEAIGTSIKNVICDYFMNLPMNTTFIPKSDIISTITNNCSGLSSIDIDIISNDNEEGRVKGYWYKHEVHVSNNTYKIVQNRQIYDELHPIGLDYYGNISLDTLLEMPVLKAGVRVYPTDNEKESIVMQDAIEIHFI